MKRAFGLAALALVATLLVPVTASADTLDASGNGVLGDTVALNTMLVFFAAVLVLFMQAGFALLEIGFSRSKNAGTGIAKILTNLSIAALAFYAVGFAFAFGNGSFMGTDGFLLQGFGDPQDGVRRDGPLRRHRSSRSGSSSSRSARCRWRSSGARRSSGSSSARTSRTRSCSPRSSTRSAPTGCSAAAGCRPAGSSSTTSA